MAEGEGLTSSGAGEIGAVVVHYHRERDLDIVLADLQDAGIDERNTVVVNNGGDANRLGRIASRRAVTWLHLENPGYAAAVNAAVSAMPAEVDRILIATHEVRLNGDTVRRLADALDDPAVSLAGPRLMDSKTGEVWSLGGELSRVRRLPRNVRLASDTTAAARDVSWLDGACLMVRRSDHEAIGGMCEDYFLYVEDVDYALVMQRDLGRRVVVVPSAIAYQSAGGALSTYLATRNILMLHRRARMRGAAALFVAESVCRVAVGSIFGRGDHRARQRDRWRGLRDGLLYRPERVTRI